MKTWLRTLILALLALASLGLLVASGCESGVAHHAGGGAAVPEPDEAERTAPHRFEEEVLYSRLGESREEVSADGIRRHSSRAPSSRSARVRPHPAFSRDQFAAGALPSLDEELWVIVKPGDDRRAHRARGPREPGCGALMTRLPDGAEPVPVPLEHTSVRGEVAGTVASVNVTQSFHNPFAAKIEAVYVFPLPQDAAVNEFVMTAGDRRIRGVIREREQAERIYEHARAQGKVASLMTQERPNIFTQRVANIEPGKRIDIDVTYFHTVAYDDGWHEWVFPMVVGPRFNPPHAPDPVHASPRGRPNPDAGSTDVQYLRPDERSGHDIDLSVLVDAGTPIEDVVCRTHAVDVETVSSHAKRVTLSPLDAVPNKDFVLRWKVAGESVRPSLLLARDDDGRGHFMLTLYPPASLDAAPRRPMEMVFVLDCSGSMDGEPLEQAKAAVSRALRRMGPDDTFQVIRFSNEASTFGRAPVPATPANVRRGLEYVDGLRANGGTMMVRGVQRALGFPHDPGRYRVVAFLTDGYIGNEREILAAVDDRLGAARIFSFGIGSSPNRYLLERMAKIGRGAVAYVGPGDPAGDVMDAFVERASRTPMTDVRVDFGALAASGVYPRTLPDVVPGRPLVITGRFDGAGPAEVVVRGRTGRDVREIRVDADPRTTGRAGDALAAVWARRAIADLVDRSATAPAHDLAFRIKRLALDHGLMSPFTAFVAVDALSRTRGDHGYTVAQPVPLPDGVRYDTTVPDRR